MTSISGQEHTLPTDAYLVLRFHLWKEKDISYRILIRKQHRQTVDPDTEPGSRRHAVFEGADKIFVQYLCLFVAARAQLHLLLKPAPLIDGVIKLAERVAEFVPVDDRLKPFDKPLFAPVLLREG